MDIRQTDEKYVAGTYKRFPVEIVSGKGSLVVDGAGKSYIDMGSGIAVNSFGLCDDTWQRAVCDQIGKVQHASNLYYTEPCARLAEQLCERTGMKKVFFSNSGAEANECAIKAARKYAAGRKGSDCYTIITLENSFHGRTLTTLAATGQDKFHALYQPLTSGFVHAPANDLGSLIKLCEKYNTAAVMIECIQGESGVNVLDEKFVQGLARFAAERDVLLIVDEVQTGNGRTGKLYGYMDYAIQPDIVTTAKGLAGGLPLGATMLGEKVKDVFGYGDHGSTFGGNPVCCAAALSILGRIDENLLQDVKRKGEYIFSELNGADGVEYVSGKGLMIGIKTVKSAQEVVNECLENGVLCLTARDKVRLLPALNIPMELLKRAVEVIKTACAQ